MKPAPAKPPRRKGKTVKLRLTFCAVEYHTIEREMTRKEFDALPHGDIMPDLDDRYGGEYMPDADIETVSWELENWKIVE